MSDSSFFSCIPRAVFNPGSLTSSYQPLNTVLGFADDIKIYKVYNGSAVAIDISYDGVNDHDIFPPNSTLIVDLQDNHADNSSNGAGTLYGRKGQVVYGKTSSSGLLLSIIGYR